MFKKLILLAIIVVYGFTSCITAEKHLQKALKKDPNIVLCDSVDTLYKYLPSIKEEISGVDSIIVDNKRIYIKAKATGKIDLEWVLKKDSIMVIEKTPIIKPRPTNRQIKLNNKKEIKIEKEKTKQIQSNNKVKIKESKAIIKKSNKNKFNWYILSFVLGFVTCFLIKK